MNREMGETGKEHSKLKDNLGGGGGGWRGKGERGIEGRGVHEWERIER